MRLEAQAAAGAAPLESAATGAGTAEMVAGYRSSLSRILANCSWLFATGVLRKLLGLVVVLEMARYLGPEKFGVFTMATAIALLFSPLAGLGLSSIVVRDLVAGAGDAGEILGTAFALKLIGGFAVAVLAYATVMWLRPADRLLQALVAMMAGATVFQSSEAVDFWFQSEVSSRFAVYARSPAFMMAAALQLVMVWVGAPLWGFGWARPLELVAGAAGVFIAYAAAGHDWRRWRVRLASARTLLADSWPLFASSVAVTIFTRIDQVMLGQMATSSDLGIYSVAVQLAEACIIVPTVVVASALPAVIEAKGQSEGLYRRRLLVLFSWLAGLAYVIAMLMTLWRRQLIALLFGAAYAGAAPVVAVYVWAGVFTFVGCADMAFWVAENLQHYVIVLTILAAGLNVLLNYLLIPVLGPMGSALATLISYGLPTIFGPALFRESRILFRLNLHALVRPFASLEGWIAPPGAAEAA